MGHFLQFRQNSIFVSLKQKSVKAENFENVLDYFYPHRNEQDTDTYDAMGGLEPDKKPKSLIDYFFG